MANDSYYDPKHGKDVDIDVDINAEVDLELKKDVEKVEKDVDVDVKEVHKKEVDIDVKEEKDVEVDVKKDVYVDVNKDVYVDVNKEVDIKEEVKKEVDIDINKDVDVDVDVWKTNVEVKSNNIHDSTDNDVNDVDYQKIVDVGPAAIVAMDDIALRTMATGKSFNGPGNDSNYAVNQSNELKDNDKLIAPSVVFWGVDKNVPQHADLLPFPTDGDAFQNVDVKGGLATTGNGISGNSNADWNQGDGGVSGDALASADNVVTTELLTQKIEMGGNQQGNFAKADVVGGDRLEANDIKGQLANGDHQDAANAAEVKKDDGHKDDGHKDGGHRDDGHKDDGHKDGVAMRDTDDDVNDLDAQGLIDVGHFSAFFMDDLRLDNTLTGESFNGPGNDMQFDVVQVNDMVDNDFLYRPEVKYVGPTGTFQDIDVEGGHAAAGTGISGNSSASNNGLDGKIAGTTSASADNVVTTEFLTQNIVMGANMQINDASANVVGGDSTIADNIDFTG